MVSVIRISSYVKIMVCIGTWESGIITPQLISLFKLCVFIKYTKCKLPKHSFPPSWYMGMLNTFFVQLPDTVAGPLHQQVAHRRNWLSPQWADSMPVLACHQLNICSLMERTQAALSSSCKRLKELKYRKNDIFIYFDLILIETGLVSL